MPCGCATRGHRCGPTCSLPTRTQWKCINIDPYANAFNDGPTGGDWQSDKTDMKLELHERKYEIDSECYPIRLAYEYWRVTGDATV